jgi:hypothetical protein
MRQTIPAAAFAAFLAFTFAVPANAQSSRAWISGMGVDSGTCPRQSPCHTLTYALTQIFSGGEITVLDPGGYGTVVINKGVSIVSDSGSGEAGVASFSGDLITVNAGPSDVVILRGLVIDGLGTANSGIRFNSGAALHVQNTLIKGVRAASGVGINFTPTAASDLHVTDTTVINNGVGLTGAGIMIKPTGSGLVRATFTRVTAEQNSAGITIDGTTSTGTIRATVRDSVLAGNNGTGLWAQSSGTPIGVYVVNSSSVENGTVGINAGGTNAAVTLMNASIFGNNIGISSTSGANIYSYKNNAINFNFGGDGAILPANVLPLN